MLPTDPLAGAWYFDSVALNVTSRCNLRCLHCYNGSGACSDGDMDCSALLGAADALVALKPFNLCLCGGEPLCCPHLPALLAHIKGKIPRISMVTNGFALDETWAQRLVKYGVTAAQVSLDGAYAWQHDSLRGTSGSFERAVHAIRMLKKAGMPQVVCSILPNRLNADSLPEYVQLCLDCGVDIVRAMPFLPSGRGRSMGRPLMLDDAGYFRFRRSLWRLARQYTGRLRIEWDDPLRIIVTMDGRRASGEAEPMIEIRADGQLALTNYLPVLLGNAAGPDGMRRLSYAFAAAWEIPQVREYIQSIHNVYDWDQLDPQPYEGKEIYLDLLEEIT